MFSWFDKRNIFIALQVFLFFLVNNQSVIRPGLSPSNRESGFSQPLLLFTPLWLNSYLLFCQMVFANLVLQLPGGLGWKQPRESPSGTLWLLLHHSGAGPGPALWEQAPLVRALALAPLQPGPCPGFQPPTHSCHLQGLPLARSGKALATWGRMPWPGAVPQLSVVSVFSVPSGCPAGALPPLVAQPSC